jgi:hypothetical protein
VTTANASPEEGARYMTATSVTFDLGGGESARTAVLFVLVGFLAGFLFIRASTRLMRSPRVPWWPGSVVTEGGVHLHHHVFGIVLMLVGGTLGFALTDDTPWVQLSALAFGIGGGLTFDEFALWVHLEDVYWKEEGRKSVDASLVAVVFVGMVLTGALPAQVDSGSTGLVITSLGVAAFVIATSAVAFSKLRLVHGYLGLLFWPLALWGAVRLAKPHSPWARRFYGERNPSKHARADERYADRRTDRFKERFRDLVGGRPTA